MDRVKVPTTLHLEYDLTAILAWGVAAAVLVFGLAIIVGLFLIGCMVTP